MINDDKSTQCIVLLRYQIYQYLSEQDLWADRPRQVPHAVSCTTSPHMDTIAQMHHARIESLGSLYSIGLYKHSTNTTKIQQPGSQAFRAGTKRVEALKAKRGRQSLKFQNRTPNGSLSLVWQLRIHPFGHSHNFTNFALFMASLKLIDHEWINQQPFKIMKAIWRQDALWT